MWLLLLSCATPDPLASPAPIATGTPLALVGGTVVGVGPADVEIDDGRIVAVGTASPDAERIDVTGRFVVPAFVDSHVHLAYRPDAAGLADGGVAAAVDLAAPLDFLAEDHAPLVVVASGPMVTAIGGYPTRSWGQDGYGLECADADEAAAAVRSLDAAGAGVIKLPVTTAPVLDDAALAAAVQAARALDLPVASHALSDDDAARAAAAGADVLAHTPTGTLSDATLDAWTGRAVISTLGAFGGSDTTVANLAALRARGATVLYGTDFGNTTTAGIDGREIALLEAAGLDGSAIVDAGTRAPATFWGLDGLGVIAPGARASLLVLDRDPTADPTALTDPEQVWIDGVRRR